MPAKADFFSEVKGLLNKGQNNIKKLIIEEVEKSADVKLEFKFLEYNPPSKITFNKVKITPTSDFQKIGFLADQIALEFDLATLLKKKQSITYLQIKQLEVILLANEIPLANLGNLEIQAKQGQSIVDNQTFQFETLKASSFRTDKNDWP